MALKPRPAQSRPFSARGFLPARRGALRTWQLIILQPGGSPISRHSGSEILILLDQLRSRQKRRTPRLTQVLSMSAKPRVVVDTEPSSFQSFAAERQAFTRARLIVGSARTDSPSAPYWPHTGGLSSRNRRSVNEVRYDPMR